MILINSKVNKKLLHIVCSKSDIKEGRTDIIPEDNRLQCAMLNLKHGTSFRKHFHIRRIQWTRQQTQESWVVIKGRVLCYFYDTNGDLLDVVTLFAGDASFTIEGGHSYFVSQDAIVYEFKTGPYKKGRDKLWLK